MSNLVEMTKADKERAVELLPPSIRDVLMSGELCVAGGYLRSVVRGEAPSDIDLWSIGFDTSKARVTLARAAGFSERQVTTNAVTVTPQAEADYPPVQLVTRWKFDCAQECVRSLDFTVCQAAIWHDQCDGWQSVCSDRFYRDIENNALVYTQPSRIEDAAGSTLRVLKYMKKGFNIDRENLSLVLARAVKGIDTSDENLTASAIARRLIQVEPDPSGELIHE